MLEAMRGNDAVFCDNHMAFHEAFVCSFGFMFPFSISYDFGQFDLNFNGQTDISKKIVL